jgi:S-(hydroxymethyl)glutathione dehydrogenase/alcohol dehydrogenase
LDLQEIRIEEYITHRLSLPEINEAVELMKRVECLRCVISME